MTFSYTNPYSVFPISPNQYGYEEISLTGDTTFAWPENNTDSQFIIAQRMDVATASSSYKFIFPPANLVGTGRAFMIFNSGTQDFTIYNNSGTSLATISSGQLYLCTVTDNSDAAGEWSVLLLGTGSSGASAAALSGYGLSPLTNSKINTNLPETVITGPYTVLATDRGTILSYTGGTNTMTLPAPVNGFIVGVVNNSTIGGLLTIAPPGGIKINGESTFILSPGYGIFITGGANYNVIGIGRISAISAPDNAKYWVSTTNPLLPNRVDLGLLSEGVVGITVTGATATPYTMPITYDSMGNTIEIGDGTTVVTINDTDNAVVTAQISTTIGLAQLSSGVVTVSASGCTLGSSVFVTPLTNGTPANHGIVSVNNVASGSFNIASTNVLDNSFVQWFIVNYI